MHRGNINRFSRISNPAASVLCVSVVLPILKDLPEESRYPRAMLLGIAYAGNVGGMTVSKNLFKYNIELI